MLAGAVKTGAAVDMAEDGGGMMNEDGRPGGVDPRGPDLCDLTRQPGTPLGIDGSNRHKIQNLLNR
jgi:hypothetical protein